MLYVSAQPEFETKLSSLLLLVGGICINCRTLQLRKSILGLELITAGDALRVAAGKTRFFSTTVKWHVAALNGRP